MKKDKTKTREILTLLAEKMKRPQTIQNTTEILEIIYKHLDILTANIRRTTGTTMDRFLDELQERPETEETKKLLEVMGRFILHRPEYAYLAYKWVLRHPYSQQLELLVQHAKTFRQNEDLTQRLYWDVVQDLKARPASVAQKTRLWNIIVLYEFNDLRPLSGYHHAMKRRS